MTKVGFSTGDATISDNGIYYITVDYNGLKLAINGSSTLY